MAKIKNFKTPAKTWITAMQFGTLGIGSGIFLVATVSPAIGIVVLLVAITAGYFINIQQQENDYATAKRAYLSYLIQFDTEQLSNVVDSTFVDKSTKATIKEFLMEYRKHEM